MSKNTLPVVLFGYASSTFTFKVKLALRLKGVPYSFVQVPSMLPRPLLRENFDMTYRKIPILAIGRDMYCDTSLIIEALESQFQTGYRSIYPDRSKRYRPLIRGFASYWTDRPLFRITTGLIPSSVWRSKFGTDRMDLIGHKLDPDKLERKIPQNLSLLDQQLSILEPLLEAADPWIFPTSSPSLADATLFYQLQWGSNIAAGIGLSDLTAGEVPDTRTQGTDLVFNDKRYPSIGAWFTRMQNYMKDLPESEVAGVTTAEALQSLAACSAEREIPMLPAAAPPLTELDTKNGLVQGAAVSITPDDTGRDHPTRGELLGISPEEAVIKPTPLGATAAPIEVRAHFPRLGFVIRPDAKQS